VKKRNRRGTERQPQESFEAYGEYQYAAQPQDEMPGAAAAVKRAQKAHARRKTSLFFKFLILLTIVTVAVVVAQQTFFRLETVYVIGNENKTPQQVVIASGLARGHNMLSITEADVAKAMSRDHTIIFKGMHKEYPGTIYLYIEERNVVACTQWLGVVYTLDGQGMVMKEQTSSILPSGIPLVTGFNANSVMEGQLLSLRSADQLAAYKSIMYELEQQVYADQITAINLADPENLYLVTLEGVTVLLGNGEHIEDKIGAVRTCMAHLRQLSVNGGILDVTDVTDLANQENEVKYMPEGA